MLHPAPPIVAILWDVGFVLSPKIAQFLIQEMNQ